MTVDRVGGWTESVNRCECEGEVVPVAGGLQVEASMEAWRL